PENVGGPITREEALFGNVKLNRIRSLPRGAAYEAPDVADEAYADGRVAAETIRRLQSAKRRREETGTPFFIASGFARPHLPFSVPRRYWDLYDPDGLPAASFVDAPAGAPKIAVKRGGEINAYKPIPAGGDPAPGSALSKTLVHGYYAGVSYIDTQIGKLNEALEELELAENTVVVLWGDHGFHLGDHGIWTKHTNFEEATRIPLIFAGPGVREGVSTAQSAESVDVYPTLAALAGLPAPTGPQPIDGVSLQAVLEDPSARVRDHAYHVYPKRKLGRAIRTVRYRLVEWTPHGAPTGPAELELYDYQTDPLETKNLATERPDVVARLRATLNAYPDPIKRGEKPAVVAARPRIWVVTDMSDPTLPGTNHRGTINDPDDVSAMAGLLLMADRFEIRGITVASTHRAEHRTTPNQADWADRVFGTAYRAAVPTLNAALHAGSPESGYQPAVRFLQSSLKPTGERFDPSKNCPDLTSYHSV
ncbi:MAG: sulfatase-like hydrolase/transferase, partial [Planctomycetota bacterium]